QEQNVRACEEMLQRGQVKQEPDVDEVIVQTQQRNDAEQFPNAYVMPVQNREQGAVIAVAGVAQHPANQAHIGELRQSPGAAVSFVEDVLRFDVEANVRGSIHAVRDVAREAAPA